MYIDYNVGSAKLFRDFLYIFKADGHCFHPVDILWLNIIITILSVRYEYKLSLQQQQSIGRNTCNTSN